MSPLDHTEHNFWSLIGSISNLSLKQLQRLTATPQLPLRLRNQSCLGEPKDKGDKKVQGGMRNIATQCLVRLSDGAWEWAWSTKWPLNSHLILGQIFLVSGNWEVYWNDIIRNKCLCIIICSLIAWKKRVHHLYSLLLGLLNLILYFFMLNWNV
jgi:hypothetical protein